MKERVQQILNAKSISASKLAEILDVQASGISHILSGRNKPSLDFIIKLLNRFPDISPDWFILGVEPMYRQEVNTNVITLGQTIQTPPDRADLNLFTKELLSEDISSKATMPAKRDNDKDGRDSPPLPDSGLTTVSSLSHDDGMMKRMVRKVMVFYSDHTVESYTYTEMD